MKPRLTEMQRRIYDMVAEDAREHVPLAELRDYLDRQGVPYAEVFDATLQQHYLNVRIDSPNSPGWVSLDGVSDS